MTKYFLASDLDVLFLANGEFAYKYSHYLSIQELNHLFLLLHLFLEFIILIIHYKLGTKVNQHYHIKNTPLSEQLQNLQEILFSIY